MDGWRENGPEADPRYIKRGSRSLGLWVAAGLLLAGVALTALVLFRPREPELPPRLMAAAEPQQLAELQKPEEQPAYLPEKAPGALSLAPEAPPAPKKPAPAPPEPAKPRPRPNEPQPAAPLPPQNNHNGPGLVEPRQPETAPAPAGAAPEAKPAPAEAKPAPAGEISPSRNKAAKAWWVVNSYSTPEAADAERILKKLLGDGYTVYSYPTEVDGRVWHRVRVGFFKSQAEAQTAGEALAQRHNLPKPWVARPGPDEMQTYRK